MSNSCPYCGHPTISDREEKPSLSFMGLSAFNNTYERCTNRSCKRFGNVVA